MDKPKHEIKIKISDDVWSTAKSRAKEQNTDVVTVITNFIEKALDTEFAELESMPKVDPNKEDDTPV